MADDDLPLPPPTVSSSAYLDRLDIPAEVARLKQGPLAPGMLTLEERAMLTRIVATTWRGEGAIIEGDMAVTSGTPVVHFEEKRGDK